MNKNLCLLYLDFDGVLHHERVLWHPKKGAYIQAERHHHLFAHASLLDHLLKPYPEIKIVLSTSWVQVYSYEESKKRLPPSLQSRVIGATFHSTMDRSEFLELSRGQQVLNDVMRRHPTAWLALDDDIEDWPVEVISNLIQTDPVDGMSAPEVLEAFQQKLRDMPGMRSWERKAMEGNFGKETEAIIGQSPYIDQSAFVNRGMAAIRRSIAAGDWVPAAEVIAKLEAKLEAAHKLSTRAQTQLDEHAVVVVNKPFPRRGLEAGAQGVIVHVYNDGEAYEVELFSATGQSMGVETVEAHWITLKS